MNIKIGLNFMEHHLVASFETHAYDSPMLTSRSSLSRSSSSSPRGLDPPRKNFPETWIWSDLQLG